MTLSAELLAARKEVAALQGRLEDSIAAGTRAESRHAAALRAEQEAAAAALAIEKAEVLHREAEVTRCEPPKKHKPQKPPKVRG